MDTTTDRNEYEDANYNPDSSEGEMNLTAITTLLDNLLSTYDKKRRPSEAGR